ncbi:hypothetical protein B7463_g7850, partial [Scytalidium lignicola]
MATEAAARTFFSSPYFAVVGASSDPTKFGHKIFTWYTHHNLPVTPINPSNPDIKAFPPPPDRELKSYPTISNISALPHPKDTGVSIITPPKVTLKVLQEAKQIGVQSVWLQPGTFDDEILAFALKEFKGGVGGNGGAGREGWCVLVDGERALRDAGREWKLHGQSAHSGLFGRLVEERVKLVNAADSDTLYKYHQLWFRDHKKTTALPHSLSSPYRVYCRMASTRKDRCSVEGSALVGCSQRVTKPPISRFRARITDYPSTYPSPLKMALPLPTGLTPMEVAFLCEMETVTVIPRQRLESIDLLGGSTQPLKPPQRAHLPLWLALLLKRQRRANILPPPWLLASSLERILRYETETDPSAFSPPPPIPRTSTLSPPFLPSSTVDSPPNHLPYHWLELSEILLESCPDDIPESDKVRTLLRDLREVRLAKMRGSTSVLEGGGVISLMGVGAMEVAEGRGFAVGVMDGLRKLGASKELARREREEEEGAGGGNDDSDEDDGMGL